MGPPHGKRFTLLQASRVRQRDVGGGGEEWTDEELRRRWTDEEWTAPRRTDEEFRRRENEQMRFEDLAKWQHDAEIVGAPQTTRKMPEKKTIGVVSEADRDSATTATTDPAAAVVPTADIAMEAATDTDPTTPAAPSTDTDATTPPAKALAAPSTDTDPTTPPAKPLRKSLPQEQTPEEAATIAAENAEEAAEYQRRVRRRAEIDARKLPLDKGDTIPDTSQEELEKQDDGNDTWVTVNVTELRKQDNRLIRAYRKKVWKEHILQDRSRWIAPIPVKGYHVLEKEGRRCSV